THVSASRDATSRSAMPPPTRSVRPSAVVYCEANFGAIDGKTANGLVRHSERYEIVSVIESMRSRLAGGVALDEKPNGIPICTDLADALAQGDFVPDYFIFGMAP